MIQGFFKTVQSDVVLVCDYFTGRLERNEEVNKRLGHAAIRFFATLVMLAACFEGIAAARSVSVLEAVQKTVAAVSIYVLSHDIFVMSKNVTDMTSSVTGFATGFFNAVAENIHNFGNLVNGNTANLNLKFPYTKETILRPLWDQLFTHLHRNGQLQINDMR